MAGARQLPGIRFEVLPPPRGWDLPRMDVAGFVGFADRGPMDIPVAIEDWTEFVEVFGTEVRLAWNPERQASERGWLHDSVRAFFANGGRRCWVVRVGLGADRRRFPLPNIVAVRPTGLEQAVVVARSPGSGWDDVVVSASIGIRPLVLDRLDEDRIRLYAERADSVSRDDVIRITDAAVGSPPAPAPTPGPFGVLLVEDVTPSADPSPYPELPFAIDIALGADNKRWFSPGPLAAGAATVSWQPDETRFAWIDGGGVLTIEPGSPGTSSAPATGTIVVVAQGSGVALMLVEASQYVRSETSPVRELEIEGRWWREEPFPNLVGPVRGLALDLELTTRSSGGRRSHLGRLGLGTGHPRSWTALQRDRDRFDREERRPREIVERHAGLWADAAGEGFPLAGPDEEVTFGFPLALDLLDAGPLDALETDLSPLERDGLSTFGTELFVDEDLGRVPAARLQIEADHLLYRSADPRRLRGVHAFHPIAEVSLLAAPDAAQRPWTLLREEIPPEPAPADLPDSNPDRGPFGACLTPVDAPTDFALEPTEIGLFASWSAVGEDDVEYVLQLAERADLADAFVLYRGPSTSFAFSTRIAGNVFARVRAEVGERVSPWSATRGLTLSVPSPWKHEVVDLSHYDDTPLRETHRAMLALAAGRGDVLAVFGLPDHYGPEQIERHAALLRSEPPRDRSYCSMFHPHLLARFGDEAPVVSVPPEGFVCGVIAARTREAGAWIAPANVAMEGPVALAPLSTADADHLQRQGVNVVRSTPRGILVLGADTLSSTDDLRPINVRRLLILLRRLALREGEGLVFEPNGRVLRDAVHRNLEAVLRRLFDRGAFAGATPTEAFRVVSDGSVDSPLDTDAGRFVVEIRVAPARPLSFLVVRLVRLPDRLSVRET